jgi:phage gpG-like protein
MNGQCKYTNFYNMPIKHSSSIKKAIERVKRAQKAIPVKVSQLAVAHFKRSFVQGGFEDESIDKWKERKPGAKRNKGRAILVDTGALKKGIVKQVSGANVKVHVIGPGAAYADVHNFGFRGVQYVKPHKRQAIMKRKVQGSFQGTAKKRRAKTIEIMGRRHNVKGFSRKVNLPKRQFIGKSAKLNRAIGQMIKDQLKQALNGN